MICCVFYRETQMQLQHKINKYVNSLFHAFNVYIINTFSIFHVLTFQTKTLFSLVRATKYLSKGSHISPSTLPLGSVNNYGGLLSFIFLIGFYETYYKL